MKKARLIFCFILLLTGILVISQAAAVFAQDEEEKEPIPPSVTITSKYPTVEVKSPEKAEFEVELKFGGDILGDPRVFDLIVTGPKDWLTEITPKYPKDKKISSIQLLPGFQVGEQILVHALPAYWIKPEPGDYTITLQAVSEDLSASIDLTTRVTAKYEVALLPTTERFSIPATAGKDNYFSIDLVNSGSAPIDEIKLSSSKPEEWTVVFTPNRVDSLPALDFQTIDVNVKPPPRTIAGDYQITLIATGEQATAESLKIRVTVQTPTIWAWVGIVIVIVVVVGLIITFRQFSRR